MNHTEKSLKVDENLNLVATVAPDNATNKTVTWKSSNEDVAIVENGVVTAKKEGTATITVTTVDGNKTATCEITVEETEEQVSPESIALNKTSETLDLNGTKEIQLSVTITPNNANVNKGITWTSSDTKVATVDNTGKVTAVGKGTTTITAKTENGKTATCEITVKDSGEEDNGNENNNNNNSNDNNKNTENTVSKNDKTEEVPSKLPYTGSLRSIITVVIILIIISAAFCYIKLKQYKYIK